jgi:hypothetical protein
MLLTNNCMLAAPTCPYWVQCNMFLTGSNMAVEMVAETVYQCNACTAYIQQIMLATPCMLAW